MKVDLYVDGSFYNSQSDRTYGGFVVVNGDTNDIISCRRVTTYNPHFVKMRNAGGEVIAAMCGLADAYSVCIHNNCNIVEIFYDYRGIADFVTGVYNAKQEGMKAYTTFVRLLMHKYSGVKLRFTKVKAHSNVLYNELADRVAKGETPSYYKAFQKSDIEIGG